MIGGLMRTSSRFAIMATAGLFAGGLALTPAQAADLGGDCCADLEERVAELEKTTVRKGNRKLSLTLSGHVNAAVAFFSAETADGDIDDSDVYVIDNDNSMTRFRLRGAAKFKPGWEAGIYIEIGVRSAGSAGTGPDGDNDAIGSGNGDDGVPNSLLIRHANWYMKNDRLGRLQVGQGSGAADGITEIDLSSTSIIGYANGESIFSVANYGVTPYFSADGNRHNNVRYDSPSLMGLVASVSWGEDDRTEAALRYKKEFNGLRFAAGVGYVSFNDERDNGPTDSGDFEAIGMSMSFWHLPSGFFGVAAANFGEFNEDEDTGSVFAVDDVESYYFKLGIQRRFSPLGQTAIFGEYGYTDWDIDPATGVDAISDNDAGFIAGVRESTDMDFFGVGVVQLISAAATELYFGYRHYEDDEGDELDVVGVGARIKF